MFRWLPVAGLALGASFGAAAASGGGGIGQHGAITIRSNADFTAVGSPKGCACVSAGNGTAGQPYVIGPWAIPVPSGGTSGWAVEVDNSGHTVSASFAIEGISAGYQDVPFTDPVIKLVDVQNPAGTSITNVTANGDGRGLELDGSADITVDRLSFNKMTGNALFINASSYVTLSNSKLKSTADGQVPHNADGLYALNSDHLTIGGVAACPKAQVCNTFDYDTGWGVYLQNTHDVTIDKASANADDTGAFILDNAWNVTLDNSNADGGGPICITLNGHKTFTGYHTDMQGGLLLVNGSHHNAFHDDQFAANTGIGVGSGGNGFFFDPCTNSQDPFSPVEKPMGIDNTFTNVCYGSNRVGLPPNPCP
jgi:hypothetical protein